MVTVEVLEDGTFKVYKEGEIPKSMTITFKDLKTWDLNLLYGTRGAESTYFISKEGHKVGDIYIENGKRYEVKQVFDSALPKGTELSIEISWELGRLVANFYLTHEGKKEHLIAIPIEELLQRLIRKRKLGTLGKSEMLIGEMVKIVKAHLPCDRGLDIETADPKFRRILRSVKKVFKGDIAAGQILLRYCGKESSGGEYYYLEIEVPAINLINPEVADRIDKLLAMLK
ncbi:MAG: UPF0128 family protein [Candidatus Asgardarchaeia archaeon]